MKRGYSTKIKDRDSELMLMFLTACITVAAIVAGVAKWVIYAS